MSDLLDAAYRYVHAGYELFPVHTVVDGRCSCGKTHDDRLRDIGKHPVTANGLHAASNALEHIETWWLDHDWNIGLRTGSASGVMAIDVDGPEGVAELEALEAEHGRLPVTFTTRTGRDDVSRHFVFRIPAGRVVKSKQLAPHVDTRGENGYVILPPSAHRSGRTYEVLDGRDPVECPAWVLDALEPDVASLITASAADVDLEALPESVRRLLDEEPGDRSAQSFRFVGRCVREGLDDATTLGAIQRHPPSVDKYGSRLDGEARRALGKIRAAGDPVGDWMQRIATNGAGGHGDEDTVAVAPDGYRLTDTGNASRLIALCPDCFHYAHAWGRWLVYDGSRWRVDENDALITERAKGVARELLRLSTDETLSRDDREALFKWALRSEQSGPIASMVKLARGMPGVIVEHEQLDTDLHLLNVANGTIDLRTGELRPHDPADLCTKIVPVNYDPDIHSELWKACLATWQPDPEMRDYLQLEAGAAATGEHTETFSIHWGTGGNGKSRFWGAMQHVLGDYTVEPHKSLLVAGRFEQHETVRADLFRARLAVASETQAAAELDEEAVKSITGGDRLRARRMREDRWSFLPTHTLVVFSNHKPRVSGRGEDVWRRVRLVPWSVTIPKADRDRNLASKLAREATGILTWIVEGARRFLADGFDPPAAVEAATTDYRAEEDVVGRFAAECLTVGHGWALSADIAEEAERWAAGQGIDPPTLGEVAAVLKDAGCTHGRRTIAGRKYSYWRGVGIGTGVPDTGPDQP
jgi:putative DNA primase/helicase